MTPLSGPVGEVTTVPIAADPGATAWQRHYLIPTASALLPLVSLSLAGNYFAAVLCSAFLWTAVALFLKKMDGSRRVRFVVGNGRLQVTGDMFADCYALSGLDLEAAEAVDVKTNPRWGLRWRVLGTGLPVYKAGEYTLKDGSRAVVFIADLSRVLRIPRGREPALLVSVADPLAFKALLIAAKG